jgi:GT2 family glycosyltransferase
MLLEKIPIVIVNWNEALLLKECLKSLVAINSSCKSIGIKARVLIIDNGSSDTSFKVINDFVARNESNIQFEAVWKADKLGFVRSNNLGIRRGFEDASVRFVATLNNDTVVDQDWLCNLYKFAINTKKKDKIGMFASKINVLEVVNKDEVKFQVSICRTDTPYNHGHSYHQDGACLDMPGSKADRNKIFCHCHAGSLLSREMLEECGMTDEDYFGWNDCPNQGWKARLRGWKARLVPDAKMWHRKSEARHRPNIRGIVERNRILNILRFMPLDKRPLAIGEYLNQSRRDGTTYEQKLCAIADAHKLFRGEYPADPTVRNAVYDAHCLPRVKKSDFNK